DLAPYIQLWEESRKLEVATTLGQR
ncbi:MAG: hypothetical protein JWN63_2857, partial [Candidatus Acidoferrum typicum]|nr:hypothetical protein [Candidatus Acidoferrum typicum]